MDADPIATRACIMVSLDGSPAAEAVLPHAVTLARATSATLDLVNVVEPSSARWAGGPSQTLGSGYLNKPREADLEDARYYLASVRHRFSGEGLKMRVEVLEGDPGMALVRRAERDPGITMLAMTTHGRSGLSRWPLGSVAEKVLCATDKPLLLVRPGEGIEVPSFSSYDVILTPLDGSVLAEQALAQARALALGTGAALLLVSAVASPDDIGLLPSGVHLPVSLSAWQGEVDAISCYLQRTASELCGRTPGLAVEIRVVAGDPAGAILSISEQARAGLIVMSTHGLAAKQARGRAHTWLGSIALKVVQSASSPVLLLRSKEVCAFEQRSDNEGLQNHLDNRVRAPHSSVKA